MDKKERILDLLRTLSGEKINICGEIYRVIQSEPDCGADLMQFFFESSEGVKSSRETEARSIFTAGDVMDYTKQYGKFVDGLLEQLLMQRPKREVFYKMLWEKITSKELFEDEKLQIFALYYVWIDARIPYFELPESICLEEGQYRQIVNALRPKIQEARFILVSDLEQWTEASYLLLQLLDSVSSVEEKAVLLSCILQICTRTSAQSMFQQISEANILVEDE